MKQGKILAGALLTGAAACMVYAATSKKMKPSRKKVTRALEKTMRNCSCFLDDMASMMK